MPDLFADKKPFINSCFLSKEIPAWVIYAFQARVKLSVDGQLMFAHQDLQGRVVGWEIGDHELMGQRHFFAAHIGTAVNRLVISPRAKRILHSFADHGRPGDYCVSTGGSITPDQERVFKEIAQGIPSAVCIGPGERTYAEKIKSFLQGVDVIFTPETTGSTSQQESITNEDGSVDRHLTTTNPLGDPGDPVTIEQLDAIFSGHPEEKRHNRRTKTNQKAAPLLAFF